MKKRQQYEKQEGEENHGVRKDFSPFLSWEILDHV